MNKFYETLTNTRGDALLGYRAQVVDSAGAIVDIYQDQGGTRFRDASGNVINYATTDTQTGMAEFYWEAATGHILQILDPNGSLARPPIAGFGDNFVLDNLSGNVSQGAISGASTWDVERLSVPATSCGCYHELHAFQELCCEVCFAEQPAVVVKRCWSMHLHDCPDGVEGHSDKIIVGKVLAVQHLHET